MCLEQMNLVEVFALIHIKVDFFFFLVDFKFILAQVRCYYFVYISKDCINEALEKSPNFLLKKEEKKKEIIWWKRIIS